MKKTVFAAAVIVAAQAAAANAGVNLNVNIGAPPVVVAPAPAPPVAYAPPPPVAPGPPEVVFAAAPRFIFSPTLGFYVSVEAPYDVVFIDGRYYLWSGGYWYSSRYYDGPWVVARKRFLPPGLHRFRYEDIRRHRDAEYRHFVHDRDRYRGRWYTPEERRHERHERREERREERHDRR